LAWYADNPCPPDVFGINHYITSERFLDERVQRYPAHTHGSNGRDHYADVEAVRALQGGCAGAGTLLLEAWDRYRRPVAITEAHLGCTSEEQMRWLAEVYREATWAREEGGADIQGVTVWSLFGATDWDSLLTKHRGSYEPGVWDTRGRPEPRATGLVHVCRSLAAGKEPDHPVLVSLGWWDRDDCRLLYPPVEAELIAEAFAERRCPAIEPGSARDARPVLITGAAGRLGSALVRACTARGLAFVALDGRSELDIADGDAVARAIDEHRPWAVVNAAGYAGTGAAEADTYGCLRSNAKGPAVLTRECARRGVPLVLFSSALVFDGVKAPEPYVESDAPAATPSGVYARSKVQMEALTRREMAAGAAPGARLLIVRTASLFGASEGHEGGGDFLTRALASLASGAPVLAACDETLTPAYLPDVTHRTLDLLIDGEDGVWHLAHSGAATRAEIVRRAAELAGIDARGLRAVPLADIEQHKPRRSPWAVLGSERTATPLLCPLEDALRRFVADSEAVRAWACLSAERRGEFARRLIDGEPLVRK